MLIQNQVGPVNNATGTIQVARGGASGEFVVNGLHGAYYEQAYRGNLFYAYSAATAMTAVGTGMVGLQLYNPTGSGVNLVVANVGVNVIVTSASVTSIVLAGGKGQASAPTSQTAASGTGTTFIGSSKVPQGLATNAGTFVNAPTAIFPILHNTAAIATTGEDAGSLIDMQGSIIIAPGAYLAFATVGATASAGAVNSAIMWEEVPI